MARARAGAAAVLLLLTLAGCAEDADPVDAGSSAMPSSSTEPTPEDDRPRRGQGGAGEPGAEASDLASAVEDLAQEQEPIEPRRGPVLGADVSWPQCPKGMGIPEKRTLGLPMPLPDAEYVVIGLTNGPGFTPNPCLADQVDWVAERHLMAAAYAVSSYPDAATVEEYGGDGPFDESTRAGRLKNVGYQQALFNVQSMEDVALDTPVVWIDVEPVSHFEWSTDVEANAAVVEGAARAYTDAGYRIGVYSTPYLWEVVVGDLRLGVPEWRAAGETSRAEALRRCDAAWSIQGGEAVLSQWVDDRRDQNVTCPGTSADLARWFHQY